MDNIFEIIVPLVIAGVYFFGNMLSNKSDDDAAPGAPRRATDEDADAIERQRRIQEEIRRKIMQRRSEGEGDRSRSAVPDSTQEREHARPQPSQPARPPVREFRAPDLVTQGTNPYETEMQAKLEQIEATRRQAEKLKQQVRASSPQQRASAQSRSRSQPTSRATRRPIRSTLHDPAAARTAFIYGEVLGPPISQRKSQTVPGLAN
ncbi:hypothetical protein ACWPKS_13870 [Coraliomargarita sp. W4R72]